MILGVGMLGVLVGKSTTFLVLVLFLRLVSELLLDLPPFFRLPPPVSDTGLPETSTSPVFSLEVSFRLFSSVSFLPVVSEISITLPSFF